MAEQLNEEKLADAFHLMWDYFPEPCTLVHKSKRVVAVNPAGGEMGLETGMICSKLGPAEAHKGCLASKAVFTGKAHYMSVPKDDKESLVYWLPVAGSPDYYIHFGTRVTIDYT